MPTSKVSIVTCDTSKFSASADFEVDDLIAFGAEGGCTCKIAQVATRSEQGSVRPMASVLPVTPRAVVPPTPACRLAPALLAGLVAGELSSCTSSTQHPAAPSAPIASGPALTTHTDAAFSLSVPSTWTYKEGGERKAVYNNSIGPKGPSRCERAVLVTRTTHADA